MIKTYLKSYLHLLIVILLLTIILSITNYFIPYDNKIPMIIIPTLAIFSSCIILGKYCKQKAYLEGIKFSLIYLLLMTIFKLLIHSEFNYKVFIIYFLLLIASIIGSMLGINIKKE